jgi:Secretion system C-terminal sorting domain
MKIFTKTGLKNRTYILLLSFFSFSFLFLSSVQAQEIRGSTGTGEMGITVSVAELQRLSDEASRHPKPIRIREEFEVHGRRNRPGAPGAVAASQWPLPGQAASDNTRAITATQTIHSNFLAITLAEGGAVPPDSMGDVGPTQVCIASNGRLKFYAKNTVCAAAQTNATTTLATALAGPAVNLDLDTFFSPVAGASGVSDPHVRYDRLSGRWFIVAIDLRTAPNRCVIAVSSGSAVTGAASFTFFFFVFDALTPVPASPYAGGFFDYPTLGVDANALYIGGRMFNAAGTAYTGGSLFVVRKSSILAAGPIVTTAFHQIGTTTTGIYTPQGVDNDDPSATVGYFIGVDQGVFNRLVLHRISTPGGTPTATAAINITSGITTSSPLTQVSSGAAQNMDANDDRLFAAAVIKNKITGASSLWTAHAIAVTTAGVAATTGTGRRNGLRWYELNNLGATPALVQSGTVFDNAATNPRGYWFPSITATGQGHAVIASSTASAVNFADVAIAGRYAGDALGTMQAPIFATASSTAYNPAFDTGNPNRWGDYSQTVVDPDDDMTVWTFQEYANGTDSWSVRAVQLKAPPPATPNAIGTIGCGNNSGPNRVTTITINGTSVSSSGFFDPGTDAGGPGFARRLAVSSTGGVTTSAVTFTSATQMGVTLTWPAALAGTTQTLTITNPDCQTVTANYTLPVGCISVPVQWLSFTGKDIGRRVQLNWNTGYESENRYFEIEKSNGNNRFEVIGKLNSRGISGSAYELIDPNPYPVNYYRIKQVSADNSFTYSDVVVVEIRNKNVFAVYPNPARTQLNIEYPESFVNGIAVLLNGLGEQVLQQKINGLNKITMDVSGVPAGTYFVELRSPQGKRERLQVVVERRQPNPRP